MQGSSFTFQTYDLAPDEGLSLVENPIQHPDAIEGVHSHRQIVAPALHVDIPTRDIEWWNINVLKKVEIVA